MNVNKKKLTKEYSDRRKLGQFFTSEKLVARITEVFDIDYSGKLILEPSFGGCSFISYIVENSFNSKITAVDIDKKLCDKFSKIFPGIQFICNDFLGLGENSKFDIIIGNPPFNLKTHYGYCDTTEGFLKKSLTMLKPGGCLYFVMPSTILRNKQYQSLREFIINGYQIIGIINTSDYEFLGADIETVVIGIKNERVCEQKYFYLNNGKTDRVTLQINERRTILLRNTDLYNSLKIRFARTSIGEIFNVGRGSSVTADRLRGRQINFYGYFFEQQKGENYFIGLQNVAYRFTSNLIKGDVKNISDTVTVLNPKERLDYRYLCFVSEYLNSSVANYLLHINALNNCRLTIHIDKYYISDIFIPEYDRSFETYIKEINEIVNTDAVGKFRDDYFYKLLKLLPEEVDEIESIWSYPVFKSKLKFTLKDEE